VMPVYPQLAKSARVQGSVEFTALISKEGMIGRLRLVRGHPLLIEAAKEAVLQWRYRPTLLNGVPVDVVTNITVNFTLDK
jgi:protein TonB